MHALVQWIYTKENMDSTITSKHYMHVQKCITKTEKFITTLLRYKTSFHLPSDFRQIPKSSPQWHCCDIAYMG